MSNPRYITPRSEKTKQKHDKVISLYNSGCGLTVISKKTGYKVTSIRTVLSVYGHKRGCKVFNVYLPKNVYEKYFDLAAERHMAINLFTSEILCTIATDDLFNAVLDEDK